MSNKNETKEEKKVAKKDMLKDPNFKQLYDVWGLLSQIEMLKQVYFMPDAEEKSDERSN